MSRPHFHLCCTSCGTRLNRAWLTRALTTTRRWGYGLETIGWGHPRKLGDIPLLTTHPELVRRWLGRDADALAAMMVSGVADLVRAGWNTEYLTWIADVLEQWGFVSRIGNSAVADSPPERVVGNSRVGAVSVASTTIRDLCDAAPPHAMTPRATRSAPAAAPLNATPPVGMARAAPAVPATPSLRASLPPGAARAAPAVPTSSPALVSASPTLASTDFGSINLAAHVGQVTWE